MPEDRPGEFVAFDLETTGLFGEIDRIVEIGAVRFDSSGAELGRFESLVQPGRPMSPAAQAVHGISDADLIDAPLPAEVLPRFLSFLGDPATTRLMAHNAAFDAGFLGRELARQGLPQPRHEVIDTLPLARQVLPTAPNHRLDTLTRLLGLDSGPGHRALTDSFRVRALWLALGGGRAVTVAYPIVNVEAGADPAPIGWDLMAAAMTRGRRVRMVYAGGTHGPAPREITPRRFAHRGGVAYLIGFCHRDSYEKSFRLDRVCRYEVVDSPGPST